MGGMRAIRHLAAVLAGASVMWLAHSVALPLLRLLPGLETQVDELLRIHPQMSLAMSVAAFVAMAAVMSILQEAPRKHGLSLSVWCGLLAGSVTFDSRLAETPRHLYDVVLWFAVCRALGVIGGAALMFRLRKSWVERERVEISKAQEYADLP